MLPIAALLGTSVAAPPETPLAIGPLFPPHLVALLPLAWIVVGLAAVRLLTTRPGQSTAAAGVEGADARALAPSKS